MKRITKGAVLWGIVCSTLCFYLGNRAGALWLDGAALGLLERINTVFGQLLWAILERPVFLDLRHEALTVGGACAALVWVGWLYFMSDVHQYMAGVEHGSARWGSKEDITPLMDKNPDQNILLSATEAITLGKPKSFENDRNKNVCIVGGSGSGKTFSLIKPNLMQLHSSYVITDPKGTLLPETGYLFTENGYRLRAFNTVNFAKSLHYNPLAYIHSEKDILKVVNVLITNTKDPDAKGGDPFWEKCEVLLYSSLIAYLWSEARQEDQNIPTMIDLLDVADVREDDEGYQSPLDIIFEDLEKKKPGCFAVRQYSKFRKAAGKTMKSILISCGARLAPFDIPELREIMAYDELELDTLGDQKTALFVIMSDTDSTFAFLIAMMMYQMFNLLCEKADDVYCGLLPVHVRCLLDEFANIGKIPDFEHLITTIRSRGISATLCLQSIAQLEPVYEKNAQTIIDGCDSLVFLGGKSTKTTEEISKMIGKTTVANKNASQSRGTMSSYTLSEQILGRDLIDPAEIGKLPRDECLVLITGLPPFKSRKYNTSKHKRFCFLADSHKRPRFEIEKHSDEGPRFFDHVDEALVVPVALGQEESPTQEDGEIADLSELNTLLKT